MSTLAKTKIEATCENCGKKLSVTLQQVADQKIVRCPKCATSIQLKDKAGKTKLLLRKMDDITKRLQNLSGK